MAFLGSDSSNETNETQIYNANNQQYNFTRNTTIFEKNKKKIKKFPLFCLGFFLSCYILDALQIGRGKPMALNRPQSPQSYCGKSVSGKKMLITSIFSEPEVTSSIRNSSPSRTETKLRQKSITNILIRIDRCPRKP